MGLGLALDFLPRPSGILRRRATAEALGRALLDEAVNAWPLLDGFACIRAHEGCWLMQLVPCEEEVQVEQIENRVRFSARTSTCGPGYHAFLVGLLDRVAQKDGGAWHDAGAEEDSTLLDETGYFEERDFARLQRSMSDWLRALGSSVAGGELSDSSRICMPLDSPDTLEPGMLTPAEVRPRGFFANLAQLEGEALECAAAEWFAWWNEGTQAASLGLARALLFQLPWHVPSTDGERAQSSFALACLAAVPPETPFGGDPASVLRRELQALVAPNASDGAPRTGGFGYRRGLVRFHPHANCAVTLPGYWYRTVEDDESVAGYWHGERALHLSSYSVHAEGRPRSAASILAEQLARRPSTAVWHCEWTEDQNPGVAWCERRESDEVFYVLTVFKAADGALIHATLTYTREADHDWAKETAAGIRAAK